MNVWTALGGTGRVELGRSWANYGPAFDRTHETTLWTLH